MLRKAFVTAGCPNCRNVLMPIMEANSKVRLKKMIDIVDSYEWEHFKMMLNPIMNKLPFDSYPTLFIDGIKITNILTKDQLRAFLDGFMEQDKIIEGDGDRWLRKKI